MFKNKLKEKLINGEVVIGPFLKIVDPAIVEIAGKAGFDFVLIDTEHGPISIESAQNMIRAAEVVNITPIIRVLENDEGKILRALDIGAHGVEVPQINSKKQATNLRKAAKFSPQGERGVCCYVRSADYSQINSSNELKRNYFKNANKETLIIAHIEGLDGIKNIDEILEEDVIDVLFLGPYDLSQSLGIPGEVSDIKVEKKMKEIIEKASNKNKIIGTFVDNAEDARKWIAAGVQFIAYSVDVGIFYNACTNILTDLKL